MQEKKELTLKDVSDLALTKYWAERLGKDYLLQEEGEFIVMKQNFEAIAFLKSNQSFHSSYANPQPFVRKNVVYPQVKVEQAAPLVTSKIKKKAK